MYGCVIVFSLYIFGRVINLFFFQSFIISFFMKNEVIFPLKPVKRKMKSLLAFAVNSINSNKFLTHSPGTHIHTHTNRHIRVFIIIIFFHTDFQVIFLFPHLPSLYFLSGLCNSYCIIRYPVKRRYAKCGWVGACCCMIVYYS